jgi:DNA mismatch repair protein MutS2
VDEHSLQRLEIDRVTASIADRATSPAAKAQLASSAPFVDRAARLLANERLAEAIARESEPGAWSHVGPDDVATLLGGETPEPLDGLSLLQIRDWLASARMTRLAWTETDAERYPRLREIAMGLPELDSLERRLGESLDDDGTVRDSASSALKKARNAVREGERSLERNLERWARGFGEGTYVTRHGDRFVALVPAAGFSRRQGIVHDVSASGHSLFVEPLEACESNNRLTELRATVTEEERRILRELNEAVIAGEAELRAIAAGLVELDRLAACARWARDHDAIALEPGGERLVLRHGVHPLLADSVGASAVPLDLALDSQARLLLVSGPNMGGKTVALKTVGLCCALAHAALPVPALEGSAVPELEQVIVDLGDEQSITQGLSTFAAHLKALNAMATAAGPTTLVLCDELGAGTDPDEGAALGQALLEHFVSRKTWGVVTTHLGSLKRVASSLGGVVNASMEFDEEKLEPRYRLLAGIPGASRALAMAERLGFDRELLARAHHVTPDTARAVERLLSDLQRVRGDLEAERSKLSAAREQAEAATEGFRAAERDARETLKDMRRRLLAESDALLARARELWQTVQREARRHDRSRESAARLREQIESTDRERDALGSTVDAAAASFGVGETSGERAHRRAALGPGSKVRVADLGIVAEIASGPDADGRVVLRRDGWTIQSHVERLEPAEANANGSSEPTPAPAPKRAATWSVPDEAPSLDVDLRGMDVEEAIRALDHGLDRGLVSGLSELRIIHGIGRGVLRSAVERHLREHPQVASSRMGEPNEGGRGVTVARLR